MSGYPKRKKLRAALLKRAEQELGEKRVALDYVLAWVASGGSVKALAVSVQEEICESVSRNFMSFVVHGLSPDATALIVSARRSAKSSRVCVLGGLR